MLGCPMICSPVCSDQRYWQLLEAVVLQACRGLPEVRSWDGVHTTAPLLPPTHPQHLLGTGSKDLTTTNAVCCGFVCVVCHPDITALVDWA